METRDFKDRINDFFFKDFELVDELTTKLLSIQIGRDYEESTNLLNRIIQSSRSLLKEPSLKDRIFNKFKPISAQTVLDEIGNNKANILLLQKETERRLELLGNLIVELQNANLALNTKLEKKDAARREIIFSYPTSLHNEINNYFDRVLSDINTKLIVQNQIISNVELITASYASVMKSIAVLNDTLLPSIDLFNVLQKQRGIKRVRVDETVYQTGNATSLSCSNRVITSFDLMEKTVEELNENLAKVRNMAKVKNMGHSHEL